MAQLIANARMYSVAPGAAQAWDRLFDWLGRASGVKLTVLDWSYPAKLSELWARDDLAATFLCGWPWLRLGRRHQILAAPVPAAAYAAGRPVYRTHFVVHRDAPFERLEDVFGHRFAFTIEDSHSGYNAPRRHLLKYRTGSAPLFREVIGPLTTVRRMLEAIADRRTDVGPLDSFGYDLLCRHDPSLAGQTRVLASTDPIPMPSLVASKNVPQHVVSRLRASLLEVGSQPDLERLRGELCLTGFAGLDPGAYEVAEAWAREAEDRGLERIT